MRAQLIRTQSGENWQRSDGEGVENSHNQLACSLHLFVVSRCSVEFFRKQLSIVNRVQNKLKRKKLLKKSQSQLIEVSYTQCIQFTSQCYPFTRVMSDTYESVRLKKRNRGHIEKRNRSIHTYRIIDIERISILRTNFLQMTPIAKRVRTA